MIRKTIVKHKLVLSISLLLLALVLFYPQAKTKEEHICGNLAFCSYNHVQIEITEVGIPAKHLTYEKSIEVNDAKDQENKLIFHEKAFFINVLCWLFVSLGLMKMNRLRLHANNRD